MKNVKTRQGAILLETLIVLPVYMVLIGGIMWIGDLSLAKQQCIIADRYGAWNLGNMHRGSYSRLGKDLQERFFPTKAHPHQTSTLSPSGPANKNRWWNAAYARARLQMSMPVWTRGWLSTASEVHLGETVEEQLSVEGRDVSGIKHHTVIMRTWHSKEDTYPRNWSGRSLSGLTGAWSWLVADEPWPMDPRTMPRVSMLDGEEYERYEPYAAISE